MSDKVMKLIEDVKALTVLELSELVKALEEEFGVSAAAPVPAFFYCHLSMKIIPGRTVGR